MSEEIAPSVCNVNTTVSPVDESLEDELYDDPTNVVNANEAVSQVAVRKLSEYERKLELANFDPAVELLEFYKDLQEAGCGDTHAQKMAYLKLKRETLKDLQSIRMQQYELGWRIKKLDVEKNKQEKQLNVTLLVPDYNAMSTEPPKIVDKSNAIEIKVTDGK